MKTTFLALGLFILISLLSLNKSSGQWTTSGNNIYNSNTGNVGIGNNTPGSLLYVAKNMGEPTITIRNLGGGGGATYSMIDDASGANWKFKATAPWADSRSGTMPMRLMYLPLKAIARQMQSM
jgi:hypothetical protein